MLCCGGGCGGSVECDEEFEFECFERCKWVSDEGGGGGGTRREPPATESPSMLELVRKMDEFSFGASCLADLFNSLIVYFRLDDLRSWRLICFVFWWWCC